MYRRGMLNDMERHQIAREIWLHIQLAHPSIIALYAAWKDRDYIYLVLEWAPEVCVCARGRCCEVPCPPRLGREGARVGDAAFHGPGLLLAEAALQVEHHLKSGRREKEGDGWVSVSAAKLAHGAAGAQTLPLAAGAEEQLARPSPSASTRGPAARQS